MFLALGILLKLQGAARQEIQAQYDRWEQAYMKRDVDRLIAILSPDYTLTTSTKATLTYDVYVAKLRLMRSLPLDPTKYRADIKSLTMRGDEADVISIESMETKSSDPKAVVPTVIIHRHEYLDTWIHYDAGWRLRRTVTVKESTVTSKSRT